MRSEVIVYGSVQMSISKSIQCRYIANVLLRVHASWQCQWGKKNLWLRFHLKQLDTYHNTTECFVCQKSWLKLTQMPSTCNCKYSQENIQRFESFFAHISKTKRIRIYYVIEFWMKPFVFVSKWSGMLTSNLFGVDFGNKSHLKTKCRFLLSNSIIFTLWHQKNKYWKWENDIHTHA